MSKKWSHQLIHHTRQVGIFFFFFDRPRQVKEMIERERVYQFLLGLNLEYDQGCDCVYGPTMCIIDINMHH